MNSIRISILGREYALRVHEGDEEQTRRLARLVDDRMRRFQKAHPEQAELTTAVMTALTLAEELHDLREETAQAEQAINGELDALADRLAEALVEEEKDSHQPFRTEQRRP